MPYIIYLVLGASLLAFGLKIGILLAPSEALSVTTGDSTVPPAFPSRSPALRISDAT
jgi:hypothetical protein